MSVLLTENPQLARDTARKFAEERIAPRVAAIDHDDTSPRDLYDKMAEVGLLGVSLPEEYGGAGADEVTSSLVLEERARASGAMANAVLLAKLQAEFILRAGNEEQRRRCVPDLHRLSAAAVRLPSIDQKLPINSAMLADMAEETSAARLLSHEAARFKDAGQPFGRQASKAKHVRVGRGGTDSWQCWTDPRRVRLNQGCGGQAHLP